MTFMDVLDLSDRMTVQQMMERDSFQSRLDANEPISVREFLYCLMQAWDSVAVEADVELGGQDQTFNLTVARKFMQQEGVEPQVNLLTPLLEGTDGHAKMSKSLGNSIGVTDPPKEMFGMGMRVSDDLLGKYLRLATDLPDDEIERLEALENPRDAKLAMAEALVRRYHGADAAAAEREEFLRVFSRRDAPSRIPEHDAGPPGDDGRWWIVGVMKACGFATSTGEARRLVEGGGVHLDEARVTDWQARLALKGGEVLRVGRRRYARLRV
jgi:tyrosyl-tRNA synthetase